MKFFDGAGIREQGLGNQVSRFGSLQAVKAIKERPD